MDLSVIVALHIDAGPADPGLKSLCEQTGVPSCVWEREEVKHINFPAMQGDYFVWAAWCVALKGTGLTWDPTIAPEYIVVRPVRPASPGEYEAQCPVPNGWGPDFIDPPKADWR